MKVSYKKLWIELIERIIKGYIKKLGLAVGTMRKLSKNEEVSMTVLLRICDYLNCNIGDICECIKVQ